MFLFDDITDIPIMKYALGGLYNLEQSSIH